jgi:phage tail-like protein
MRVGERVDTAPAFWFEIDVGEQQWMVVQSVTGVGVSWEQPLEIWEDATSYRVVPTKKKWSNIVLKGAVVDEKKFFEWFDKVQLGEVGKNRREVEINLIHAGKRIARWSATGAFPVKYTGPTFDTNSAAIAFETIELTHLGLKRDS